MNARFVMKLDEEFPHLPQAPIVEAVIHWQAPPREPLEPDALLQQLKEQLPDYPQIQPQHEFSVEHQVGPERAKFNQSRSWHAFQLANPDRSYVAQFNRAGLVFSRLSPYQHWTPFNEEAMRVWEIYRQIACPPAIQRLGIRYINLVPVDSIDETERLLRRPPGFPGDLDLPLAKYVHQSRFDVPDFPLQLNLIQTVQRAPPQGNKKLNLIVDFDIFSTGPKVDLDDFHSGKLFSQMRWLKNKAFFTIFSDQAIEDFRR